MVPRVRVAVIIHNFSPDGSRIIKIKFTIIFIRTGNKHSKLRNAKKTGNEYYAFFIESFSLIFVVLNHTKNSEFFSTRIVGYVQIGAGVRTKRAAGFDTVATCTYCMEFAAVVVAVVG